MPETGGLYKCDQCGNVVEVKKSGGGELVCCGEAMRQLSPEEAKSF